MTSMLTRHPRSRNRRTALGVALGLAAALVAPQALASADVAGKLAGQGVEQRVVKPEDLPAFGRAEVTQWAELVRRSGAQVD